MASGTYNIYKADLMNGDLDLAANTIKVALMNSTHSFTATHNTWGQISDNQITGTGYTAGGSALASKVITQAATTKFDASDLAWTTASFTARHAVIYNDSHVSDNLICSLDFGGDQTVTVGTFTIQWDAAGILTLA